MLIDHSFSEFGLNEKMEGTIFVPMENLEYGMLSKGTVRNFSILFNRMYNFNDLEDIDSYLSITNYKDFDNEDEDVGESEDFLHFKLTVQKDGMDEIKEEFLSELFRLVTNSDKRGIRGKRLAFVQDFEEKSSPYGDVLTSNILINKNIFFNDYRVTSGYPNTVKEESQLLEYIFQQLTSKFPNFGIDIDAE
jgi:hypothetical protein